MKRGQARKKIGNRLRGRPSDDTRAAIIDRTPDNDIQCRDEDVMRGLRRTGTHQGRARMINRYTLSVDDAVGVIAKPFDPTQLAALVRDCVSAVTAPAEEFLTRLNEASAAPGRHHG
jgi:hypothetical protein